MDRKENNQGDKYRVEQLDATVVKKCLSGDTNAYEELVHRYQKPVFNLAYRILGNPEDAKDITQEAFVKAYQALPTYKLELSFKSWLFRIAHNLSVDSLRYKSRRPTSALDSKPVEGEGDSENDTPQHQWADTSPNPREILITKEEKNKVNQLINILPEKYKTVIILRHIEELSIEEISQTLNIPVGTVKINLFRGRQLLKEKLGSMVYES